MARRLPSVNECLNCGLELTTDFCPHCGQEAVQHTASVSQLFAELVESLFNLDSKFFRTLRSLLFKPGTLTVAYNRGQRVRYLSPLRLYLVCSIAFFVVLAWKQSQLQAPVGAVRASARPPNPAPQIVLPSIARHDSPVTVAERKPAKSKRVATGSGQSEKPTEALKKDAELQIHSLESMPESVDDYKKLLAPGEKLTPFSLYCIKQLIKIKRIGQAGIVARFFANVPNMMFLLLPIFAIALKLLYVRSRTLYVEHLVFLLHTHAFAYIVLTVLLLLPDNVVTNWAPITVPVYISLAMRKVYQQPWWKTLIKLLMLAIGYITILFVCLAATIIVTFLTV